MPNSKRTPAQLWSAQAKLMLGYFLLAYLSIQLFRHGTSIAVIWFANGWAIISLADLPYRNWPRMLAAILISLLAANLASGDQLATAIQYVPGNLAEILLGAWLVRRQRLRTGFYYSVTGVLRLMYQAVFLPVLCGALVSALVFWLQGQSVGHLLLHWVEGSIIGGVAMVPLWYWISQHGLLALIARVWRLEYFAHLLLTIGIAILAPLSIPFPFIYVSLPLFLIAYRHGLAGSVLANALVALTISTEISFGLLLPPATVYNWGLSLLYIPVLATLIPPLLLAIALDMHKAAGDALQLSEQRYRSLYQNTPAMLFSCSAEGEISSVNQLWLERMHYTAEETIGRPATDFLTPLALSIWRQNLWPRLLETGQCQNEHLQLLSRQGEVIEVLMSAALERNRRHEITRVLVVQLDITAKLKAEHLAYHDTLTNLPNRQLFNDRLSQACQQGLRHHTPFAVAFVDLDRFKAVNDQHGHKVGDLLLIEVAKRLQLATRSTDTVSRLGGDEFVLLLSGVTQGEEAQQLAEKIVTSLAEPYHLAGHTLAISASLGLSFFPHHGQDPATLLRLADEAMYIAKGNGKNGFHCHTQHGYGPS
ncbi:sensor domain-containing diguanylate cyclase [Chitinibacter tainanensis]|uniref:sensor domain-containing diguanylate cyclase n=1 Tax=Chitinibacter tainanensis TaxID=230667 RepID=UPI00042A2EE7|nr:sensor domain-containing diguanylate cyclase [Chitinibacter tainanensis]